MPGLDSIGFTGYWDADKNLVLGKAGIKLYDAPRQQVQLYKVQVGGATTLGEATYWFEGDFAFYNGYEWLRLLGPKGAAYDIANLFRNLPSTPVASPIGLWLDGGVLVYSGLFSPPVPPGPDPGPGPGPTPIPQFEITPVGGDPTVDFIPLNTIKAFRNTVTGRIGLWANDRGNLVDVTSLMLTDV